MASAAGKKSSISLTLFSEVNNLELEHELTCSATCFWSEAIWTGQVVDHVREAWNRQLWEASSWTKVRGLPGVVFCEMKELEITAPSWQVLRMSDGRMISVKDTCLEDITKTPVRHEKNVYWPIWRKKHEIEELKEEVWFERLKAMLKRKVNHRWTARHAAQARYWVISGACTQKRLYDMNWASRKNCKCCDTGKHRLYHWKEWREERNKMENAVRTYEMKARSSEEDWKWRRELMSYLPIV